LPGGGFSWQPKTATVRISRRKCHCALNPSLALPGSCLMSPAVIAPPTVVNVPASSAIYKSNSTYTVPVVNFTVPYNTTVTVTVYRLSVWTTLLTNTVSLHVRQPFILRTR
jgi:hypothetical protein